MEPERGFYLQRVSEQVPHRNTPIYINLNDMPEDGITMGRGAHATVRLHRTNEATGLSRVHAVLRYDRRRFQYSVADCDSMNGVFVNHEKVPEGETWYLRIGDLIGLADSRTPPITESGRAVGEFVYKLCTREENLDLAADAAAASERSAAGLEEGKEEERFSTEYLVDLVRQQRERILELETAQQTDAEKMTKTLAELADVRTNAQGAGEQVRELSQENDKMKRTLEVAKGIETKLRAQVNDYPKVIEGLEGEVKELKQKLATTTKDLKTKATAATKECDKVKKAHESASVNIAKLRKELADLETAKTKLEKTVIPKMSTEVTAQKKALTAEREKRRQADKMILKLREELKKSGRRGAHSKAKPHISRSKLANASSHMHRTMDKLQEKILAKLSASDKRLQIFDTRVKLLHAIQIKQSKEAKEKPTFQPDEAL